MLSSEMKLFLAAFILILVDSGSTVYADALNDSFNKIGTDLCHKTIADKAKVTEYKSLKLKGSKVDGICLLTAKTALSNCAAETARIYKDSASSKEKDKVSKVIKTSLQFCSDYSDLVATEIVNVVINEAITGKISIDEAANKIIGEASK